MEFYRRVSLSFSEKLTNSIAELSSVKKETVPPAYLSSLQDAVDIIKKLLSKAVAIVSVFPFMLFFAYPEPLTPKNLNLYSHNAFYDF